MTGTLKGTHPVILQNYNEWNLTQQKTPGITAKARQVPVKVDPEDIVSPKKQTTGKG